MCSDLQDIYRQRVIAHSREPRNQRRPADASREALGFNQLCGDKLTVYLTFEGDTVRDVAFEGTGCAISIASASMMTEALRGVSRDQALQLIEEFGAIFTADSEPEGERLDEAQALAGVRDYPSRIKCATLAWSTAAAALRGEAGQVSTE